MRSIFSSMKSLFRFLAFILSILLVAGLAGAEQRQPQLLILNSYHQGEDWSDNEIAGIVSELQKEYPHLVPMVENLDTKRFPSSVYLDTLKDTLARKYRGRTIDLIMALDNPALDLLVRHADSLFPGVPVVFAGINGYRPAMTAGRKQVTGVIERQDVAGTLAMALSLRPGVSKVLAVHDYTASGLAVRQETETALARFTGKIDITYSADAPFSELSEELKAMPEDGVVLILTYVTDKAGRTFTREESTRLITSLSPAPVYAMHETRLGFGIVGGLLLEGKEHGQQAAAMALRILKGADPGQMPVEVSRSRSILDYQEALRFHIPEHLWPANALIINRPETFWRRHRDVLIPSIAVIAALGLLSSLLAVAILRKQRAETAARTSEERLRALVDSVGEGIILQDSAERIVLWNRTAAETFAIAPEDVTNTSAKSRDWKTIRPDGSPFPVHDHPSLHTLRTGEPCDDVLMGVRRNELETRWIKINTRPLFNPGEMAPYAVIISFSDITDQRQKEETIRVREQFLRSILLTTADGFWVLNADGILTEANNAYCAMTGYPREELLGLHINDLDADESPDETKERIQRIIAKGWELFEARHRRKDDSIFPVEISSTFLPEDGGQFICFGRDLTERKRAEEALRESERRLADVIEFLPDATLAINRDKRIIVWNKAIEEMTGISSTEMVGQGDYAYTLPFYGERRPQLMDLVFEDSTETAARYPAITRQGDSLTAEVFCNALYSGRGAWVFLKASPLYDVSGQVIGAIESIRDISERKQAEERIRESEARLRESEHHFRTLANSDLALIWTSGPDKLCTYFNEPWLRYTGRTLEQELGHGWAEGVHPEDCDRCLDTYISHFDRREPFSMEYRLRKANGEYGWILDSGTPRYDSAGNFTGYIGYCYDITERKRAEEENKILNAQLQQAQKLEAIGTLAGGIAHDFNNLLGAIIGYSEIIHDDLPPGSPGTHSIKQVLKASHRAKDLVKQILAFSRQAEGLKIPMEPAGIVKETIALLRSSLPTTITIEQRIDPDAGMVLADPTQMHQIVMNLATNALHAMEVKGGTLTISLQKTILGQNDLATEPDLQPGTFVQLSIRDTGEGIPPEIRKRIFDPFFTTKVVGKGTGLGLSMVYSIVKSSGGSIACDSRVGEGTEFRILLPALEGQSVEESGSTELLPHGKEHILLIDDEEMLVELGQAMLEHLGYQVTTRTSSLEALATFQSDPHQFDAVITDQTMPGLTGLDLARQMLQIRPDLPIILCTGYSYLVDEDQAKAWGIKGFAMKPLTKKEIAALLREVLASQA